MRGIATAAVMLLVVACGGSSQPIVRTPYAACENGDDGQCFELQERCRGGDARACSVASDRAASDKNWAVVAEMMTVSCRQGDVKKGCHNLAVLGDYFRDGTHGASKNLERAAELSVVACDGGAFGACNGSGWAYRFGNGVARDLARAEHYYTKGCRHDNRTTCRELGLMFLEAEEFTRAIAPLQAACDLDDSNACAQLGYSYSRGHGVEANAQTAARLYRKACDGREGMGCNNLGALYDTDRIGSRNVYRATRLYREACDFKYELGCSNYDRKRVDFPDVVARVEADLRREEATAREEEAQAEAEEERERRAEEEKEERRERARERRDEEMRAAEHQPSAADSFARGLQEGLRNIGGTGPSARTPAAAPPAPPPSRPSSSQSSAASAASKPASHGTCSGECAKYCLCSCGGCPVCAGKKMCAPK